LLPLPIPDGKWEVVTVDFVVSLPRTASGFDAVCVFVDKLTKMCHLCPTTSEATAEDTAKLFVDYVWRYHGLPRKLVSDRGTQFVSSVFRGICSLLHINQGLSSAFHPESDGQTERLNMVMEETLRHYVNPTQDDWDRWLAVVEFALNNSVHSSTQATPFFLNYGRHPNTPLSLQTPRMKSATVPSAVKLLLTCMMLLLKPKSAW
jgi:transposase InsO family protein